jgi:hypothetical protein
MDFDFHKTKTDKKLLMEKYTIIRNLYIYIFIYIGLNT